MRVVSYKSVLAQASQLAFGKASPNGLDAATLNTFINEDAGQFWRSFWWPELMVVEQRQYRPSYSGGHAAGTEVYYPPAQAYYLAVKGPTTVPPATLSGGVYEVNKSEWIEVQTELSGDDWTTGKIYAAGDLVRNPATGLFYACHTGHTAGGSFDGTKFGALKRWRNSLDYAQTGYTEIDGIEGVYDDDPDVNPDAERFPFTLSADIIVHGDIVRPWIKLRRRIPSWSGTLHVPDETYTVGDQVYYSTDYYRAKTTTSALPTDTDDWEKIEMPYVFRSSVPRAAYAGWLASEGQIDKSGRNMAAAAKLNEDEIMEITSRQGQMRALPVKTYR